MATVTTPIRVDVVDDVDIANEHYRFSLSDAVQVSVPVLDAVMDATDPDGAEHPAVSAWDELTDEIVDELAPKVARLINEAYQRRLPWTWEGDPSE